MLSRTTFLGLILFTFPFFGGCGGFLMSSEEYLCQDSKGTLDDYKLYIHRSYFEKSNLMKIPSKVETLGAERNICYEDSETIWAGENCRGKDGENQTLVFAKNSLKIEIEVSPTIIRRANCQLSQ
tara:strand:+ start:782 stop:1156 length:375 start_codon:yes stop_codon:yes gene_type:complete